MEPRKSPESAASRRRAADLVALRASMHPSSMDPSLARLLIGWEGLSGRLVDLLEAQRRARPASHLEQAGGQDRSQRDGCCTCGCPFCGSGESQQVQRLLQIVEEQSRLLQQLTSVVCGAHGGGDESDGAARRRPQWSPVLARDGSSSDANDLGSFQGSENQGQH